jgi:WD40 repeat protein
MGEDNSVAWSPSGDKLASASSDKTATVDDSASAEQVIVTLDRDLPY